jgi:prolyl-tRNA synthetase
MGGQRSHEYQVDDPSELRQAPASGTALRQDAAGEDTIISCQSCSYAANEELAAALPTRQNPPSAADDVEVRLFGPTSLLPGATMTAVVGAKSRRLNETKLQRHLSADLRPLPLTGEEAWEWSDRPEGPLPAYEALHVVLDHECRGLEADEVGEALRAAALRYGSPPGTPAEALQDGPTLQELFPAQLQLGSEAPLEAVLPLQYADLRSVEEGDTCASCGSGQLRSTRTVEVGHTFQLGTRYSDALNATFTPSGDGPRVPYQMGCYGIGITRLLGILAAKAHERALQAGRTGFAWPLRLAPFRVLVIVDSAKEEALEAAHLVATRCGRRGLLLGQNQVSFADISVAIDDRSVRRGEKFADADLLGYPHIFVIGKHWEKTGEVEVRDRARGAAPGREETWYVRLGPLRPGRNAYVGPMTARPARQDGNPEQ